MPNLDLPAPDWENVVGGSSEAKWFADRDRKFGLAAEYTGKIHDTAAELRERGALFRATAKVLTEVPFAADWYISLAAFSKNTLRNIRDAPRQFGLTRSAIGVVEKLRNSETVPGDQVEGFAAWINHEIERLLHDEDAECVAATQVALILGGRVVGQGQNIGGNEAVVLVKSMLREHFAKTYSCEVGDGSSWEAYAPGVNLPQKTHLRFGGVVVCEFLGGGDRPDVTILDDDDVLAVGEIKGRIDLSNIWESWMPQVADHMRTWSGEYPDAARLLLGTVITQEMVKGRSVRGTARTGLKDLYSAGQLTAVYNISNAVAQDPPTIEAFKSLTRALQERIEAKSGS